jgi:hypothetical protein
MSKNKFGGSWTEAKMEIVVSYAKAYLTIMKKQSWAKTMSVKWKSIEALKGLGIDLWILVPTGIGIGRLLKNNGDISEAWLAKLEDFLGLTKVQIKNHFYKEQKVDTLFGSETVIKKEKEAVNKAGDLYRERLKTVFKFVSDSFVMRNSMNSIMYHFMMATNNPHAQGH